MHCSSFYETICLVDTIIFFNYITKILLFQYTPLKTLVQAHKVGEKGAMLKGGGFLPLKTQKALDLQGLLC